MINAAGVETLDALASSMAVPVSEYYVADIAFRATINGVVHSFRQGDLITKPYIVDRLLEGNCPISKTASPRSACACPHCGHTFFVE